MPLPFRLRHAKKPGVKLPSALIIGSGLGGLAAAISLKRLGVDDLFILERADDVGGTWRANRYPGIAVDTSILNYSFSFDPNPGWSRLYAPGTELQDYARWLVDRYGLRRHIRFNTNVAEMSFDATTHQWDVSTENGEAFHADIVVSATGLLSTPALPKIPGLENFKGTVLHSAEWNDGFDPSGRSIAQVGSGATAAQLVPELAKKADHLYVFQRSAPWVLPRKDRMIGPRESRLYQRLPAALKVLRYRRFWLNDFIAHGFEKQTSVMERQTKAALDFIDRSIEDPVLRRAVTPDYEIGCKRRVMSDDWYPALQRENVTLVPMALRSVKETSVVGADGVEREVDTIIFSTGFEVGQKVTMKVFGLEGRELQDVWSKGVKTHLGISVSGFPNLFFINGANTNIGSGSATFMIECQTRYIAQAVEYMAANGVGSLDLLSVIQDRTFREIQKRLAQSVYGSGCVGWYQNPDGSIDTLWPGMTAEYWWRTRRFNPRFYLAGTTRRRETRTQRTTVT